MKNSNVLLASHMAGLPRESPCEAMNSNCNFNNGEMWERFKNVTLVNPPGLIPQYVLLCSFPFFPFFLVFLFIYYIYIYIMFDSLVVQVF